MKLWIWVTVVVIIAFTGGIYTYYNNTSSQPVCNACGNVYISDGYEAATEMLNNSYPNRSYAVNQSAGTILSCGPCGGTSPAIFPVTKNNETTGAIIMEKDNVKQFINNISAAPPDLQEDIRDKLDLHHSNVSQR